MSHGFERPFYRGSSEPLELEAYVIGETFGAMVNALFENPNAYSSTSDRGVAKYAVVVVLEKEKKAYISGLANLKSGYYIKTVYLFEPGVTEEAWGPMIRQYSNETGNPGVTRIDCPDEETRNLTDQMLPLGSSLDEIHTACQGLALEIEMGLNGHSVDMKEVEDLEKILKQGKIVPYYDPPRGVC